MKRILLFALPILLASEGAFAAQSTGNAALALAALVGEQSPTLSPSEKAVLEKFLASDTRVALPQNTRAITVTAQKITCRMGDVDITTHSCELTFGAKTITLTGRPGQELLATMQENGVQSDGAAGTIYYSVAPITCTVEPAEVQSNAGGGAKCVYTNGP